MSEFVEIVEICNYFVLSFLKRDKENRRFYFLKVVPWMGRLECLPGKSGSNRVKIWKGESSE